MDALCQLCSFVIRAFLKVDEYFNHFALTPFPVESLTDKCKLCGYMLSYEREREIERERDADFFVQ